MKKSVNFEELSGILNILGDYSSLKIYQAAAEGFISGKETINKLGLTSRKYYRNLKTLKDKGLITNSANKYELTFLGEKLYKVVFNDIYSLLTTKYEFLKEYSDIGESNQIKIIEKYDDLIKLMIKAIDDSKSKIFLVTRYFDLSVIGSLLNALNRGVILKTITNKRLDLSNLFKILTKIITNIRPNNIKTILKQPDNKIADVMMSFIVIDDKLSIYELPTKDFTIAFNFTDEKAAKQLTNLFEEIWDSAEELHIDINKI